jgi:hypothetical protein
MQARFAQVRIDKKDLLAGAGGLRRERRGRRLAFERQRGGEGMTRDD